MVTGSLILIQLALSIILSLEPSLVTVFLINVSTVVLIAKTLFCCGCVTVEISD